MERRTHYTTSTHYVKLLQSGSYTTAQRMGGALAIFCGLDDSGKGIIRIVRYDRRKFKLLSRGAQ